MQRALVRLARDKTRERERFDRNAPVSGRAEKTLAQVSALSPQAAGLSPARRGAHWRALHGPLLSTCTCPAQDAASVADRAALQQELQAALTAVAAFKEAETIQARCVCPHEAPLLTELQSSCELLSPRGLTLFCSSQAAMAAEANARCAALEITLAEERAKVSRLLAQVRGRRLSSHHSPSLAQRASMHRKPYLFRRSLTPSCLPLCRCVPQQQARKEKEMAAIEVSAREDIAFQSPQTMTKTAAAPESPAAEAGSPEAQTVSAEHFGPRITSLL